MGKGLNMLTELDKKVTRFFYSNFNILKHSFRAEGLNSSSPDLLIDAVWSQINRGIDSQENDFHDTVKPYIVIEYAIFVHNKRGFSAELEMEFELFETLTHLREFEDHFGALQGIQIVNGRI